VQNDESEYRGPRSFDYAVATVATPDLDLRFVRVRGQFEVEISVPSPHRRWDSLDSALLWLDMQQGIQTGSDIPNWGYGFDWDSLDWWSIDRFLVENWERLKGGGKRSPIPRASMKSAGAPIPAPAPLCAEAGTTSAGQTYNPNGSQFSASAMWRPRCKRSDRVQPRVSTLFDSMSAKVYPHFAILLLAAFRRARSRRTCSALAAGRRRSSIRARRLAIAFI